MELKIPELSGSNPTVPNLYAGLRSLGWEKAEIAKEWKIGRSTLYEWEKRWGPLAYILQPDLLDFIEMSLVGDGSIVPKGDKALFSMTGSNEEYILWLRQALEGFGFKCQAIQPFIWKKEDSGFKDDCMIYSTKTRVTPALTPLREKWYPGGKKKVPADFRWTHETLIRFFCEDGSKTGYNSRLYWGAKDDMSFERFKSFVESFCVCSELSRHRTGGRVLRITGLLDTLPGYYYKGLSS